MKRFVWLCVFVLAIWLFGDVNAETPPLGWWLVAIGFAIVWSNGNTVRARPGCRVTQ
jgi:hypothetical protein